MDWKDWLEALLREFQERAAVVFQEPLLDAVADVANTAYELARLDEFLYGIDTFERACDHFHHHLTEGADGLTPAVRQAIHRIMNEAEREIGPLPAVHVRTLRLTPHGWLSVRATLETNGDPEVVVVFDAWSAGGVEAVGAALGTDGHEAASRIAALCRIIADVLDE